MVLTPNMRAKLKNNYTHVQENIGRAAIRAGRSPEDVKLLVVTKTQSIDIIECVIDAGAKYLGENYLEETLEKINALQSKKKCSWHMIGHIQSRKSNQVVEYFDYVHSLDSFKLAQRMSRQAGNQNKILPVLLEFNLGGEENKNGWRLGSERDLSAILPELERVINLPNIKVCGLMTMPPLFENPEDTRPYFRRLKNLGDMLKREYDNLEWDELSMGMSNDYEVAIEEGATWVRIGQAILGHRHT